MFAYISILVASLFTVAFSGKSRERSLLTALILMCLVGGLRFETGYDWFAYEINFSNIDLNSGIFENIANSTFEPLYTVLCIFVKSLGGSVQWVFFIAATFSTWAIYRLIREAKCDYSLSLILYVGFCYFLAYFIIVRYQIAISFFYLGFANLINGRRVHYLLCLLLGSLFHFTVILFVPLAFFVSIQLGLKRFYWVCAGIVVVSIALDFGQLLVLLERLTGGDFIGKFSVYSFGIITTIPLNVAAYALINFALCWFLVKRSHCTRNKREFIIVNFAIQLTLILIFSILVLYQIPSIWNRLMLAAVPIQGFAIAICLKGLPRTPQIITKSIIASIAVVIFSFNLLARDNFFLPYESVIHDALDLSTGVGRQRMYSAF